MPWSQTKPQSGVSFTRNSVKGVPEIRVFLHTRLLKRVTEKSTDTSISRAGIAYTILFEREEQRQSFSAASAKPP